LTKLGRPRRKRHGLRGGQEVERELVVLGEIVVAEETAIEACGS